MLGDRLSERSDRLRHQLEETGSRIKETVGEQLGQIQESAVDLAHRGRQRAVQLGRTLEHEIRHHPTRWLTISAFIGIGVGLIGYFWMRDDRSW